MHILHADCFKFSHQFNLKWLIFLTVLSRRTTEGGGLSATKERDSLRYFGSINGREYYIGNGQATWTESLQACLRGGGYMRLLEFDETSQIFDFLSLSPIGVTPMESATRIWTSGVSSPEDNDILWVGRDIYASSTDLDFNLFGLNMAADGPPGCVALHILVRPFGRKPVVSFQSGDCQSPAAYFCFFNSNEIVVEDQGGGKGIEENTLGDSDEDGPKSKAEPGPKEDPYCLLKDYPKLDLFKQEGVTLDELLKLIRLRHDYAFHLALDDDPPEMLNEEEYNSSGMRIKDSFIDVLFKIVKRLLPDRYGQYIYLNVARRMILLYFKWIEGSKRFPAKLDSELWKSYRNDLIQCYNYNLSHPFKFKYLEHKIIQASGKDISTHRVHPYSDNDVFLETLWFAFLTALGSCTPTIERMRPVKWLQEIFLDFDADFLSGFKEVWLSLNPRGLPHEGPDYTYMELGTQVFFGDINYIGAKYNLAALSVAVHRRNDLHHLMVSRPL